MEGEEVLDTPIEDTNTEETENTVPIQDSILFLTKKNIGASLEMNTFDDQIISSINTALFEANQLGVGKKGFTISDDKAKWSDFLDGSNNYEAIKSYVYIKTKLLFDPPTSSFVLSSLEKQLLTLEWRLNFEHEIQKQNDEGGAEDG